MGHLGCKNYTKDGGLNLAKKNMCFRWGRNPSSIFFAKNRQANSNNYLPKPYETAN